MINAKDGEFANTLHGNTIISEYSGAFSVIGIRAIVGDVIAKTQHLTHWAWYQRPSPDAGISPEAIEKLLQRYRTIHHNGCCAIGVLNQNVLIKSFELPHDVVCPFLISRSEKDIARFLDEHLSRLSGVRKQERQARRVDNLKANQKQIMERFLDSCNTLSFDRSDAAHLIGVASLQHDEVLNDSQLSLMEGFSALERLVLFLFDGDVEQARKWFVSPNHDLGAVPCLHCQTPNGMSELLRYISSLRSVEA